MKQVKITIEGDILAVDYCSNSLIDEDNDFTSQYYLVCGWNKIEAMHVDDSEENVVKKKGKYVKTVEMMHRLMGPDSDHPLPCELHARIYYNQSIDYVIELADEDEFDIKKVQLEKSDYELECLPYFIAAGYILYDGKRIDTDGDMDYCPEMKMYDVWEVEEFYNGE